MPKMENTGKTRQIALSQIVDTGNIREDYTDIAELAESIKLNGLLQPVAVKALGKNEDGIEQFELVAGFRRRAAHQYLVDKGEGFTSIDAVIVTGDKLTLQLVENLQRSDLTAKERERGIFLMAQSGLTNRDIAARLSKGEPFISRNITAYKIRETIEGPAIEKIKKIKEALSSLEAEREAAEGEDAKAVVQARIEKVKEGLEKAQASFVDTSEVSTQALNEIQGVEKKDLVRIIKDLIAEGGTVSVARRLKEQYNAALAKATPPLIPPAEQLGTKPSEPSGAEPEPEADTSTESYQPDIDPLASEVVADPEPEGRTGFEVPVSEEKKPAAKPKPRKIVPFDPPHKMVDVNSVQVIIKDYIDHVTNTEAGACFQFKTDAAYDIWALLLDRL